MSEGKGAEEAQLSVGTGAGSSAATRGESKHVPMEGALAVRGGAHMLRGRTGSWREGRTISVSTDGDEDEGDESKKTGIPVTNRVRVKPMNEYFDAVPVSDFELPPIGHIVTIASDASVKDAVDALVDNNVLSLPVRNAECKDEEANWDEKYIGACHRCHVCRVPQLTRR